jgi:FeS assembly SUF system regulator
MLRIAKLTDYAAVVLTRLAADPGAQYSAAELAALARLEPPTTAKVLKSLAQAGLVESRRGAGGGYRLAHAPGAITMADIVCAMEGPIGMTECVTHEGACGHEGNCGVQANWRRISVAIEAALRAVTLADMLPKAPARPIPIRMLGAEADAGKA